jgi:hypothetical protein
MRLDVLRLDQKHRMAAGNRIYLEYGLPNSFSGVCWRPWNASLAAHMAEKFFVVSIYM